MYIKKDWLVIGWRLLEKEAPHLRDYLSLAPTNNFRGFKRKELFLPDGVCSPIPNDTSCFIPKVEDIPDDYRPLLHA